jgi:hypothetical protein
MVRHPKIYVVTEEPFHDNSTLHFATLDIDQAFEFSQRLLPKTPEERYAEEIQISELDGEGGCARVWSMSMRSDANGAPPDGKWFQVSGMDRPLYEHTPGTPGARKERLIEVAEVIMTLAIEDEQCEHAARADRLHEELKKP